MPSDSPRLDLLIANALRLAANDSRDARTLRKTGSRNAAYLAEQAAEKLLRALLTSEGVDIQRQDSHRLDILVDKLPSGHPSTEQLKRITFLTIFATTYRYPKTGGRLPPEPDWRKVDAAMETVDVMIAEAADHFGVDLSASDSTPAQNIDPMRYRDDGSGGGASGGPR
ncbi:HEPN domain-containing protein [Methylosinus sp. RM1]|uniref:HEPN domain-containing protein n=1 Tax=Methylosinus sp. RM1 TaxID=2583817 RepID=UPI001409CB03|nr:HEPN domain-containing protein [Methylosinus sp. RM1]